MNIVFFGTPEYVIPILDSLHENFHTHEGSPIKAIVTQPPRPAGRKQIRTFSAVDDWAHAKNVLKLYSPQDVIDKKIDADIAILAAFGAIIPKEVIDHFPLGILNVHPSLLPKLRGASPVQSAIATNSGTGVTIIKLDEKMDHGPVVAQFRDELKRNDTTETLRDRLFTKSAKALTALLPAYKKGGVNIKAQNHKKATYTKLIKKEHGFIDWKYLKLAMDGKASSDEWKIPFVKNFVTHYSPSTIHQYIRALFPWPEIWTNVQITNTRSQKTKKRLKILNAHLEKPNHQSRVVNHYLILDKVQLEGKNPVSWKQFKEYHGKVNGIYDQRV